MKNIPFTACLPPLTSGAMNLILWHEGKENGPYDLETVQEYIRTGQLSPKMLARFDGASQWNPLETLLPKKQGAAPPPNPQKATKQDSGTVTVEAHKPGNPAARKLGVALIVASFLFFGLAYWKSSAPKGSLEALNSKFAQELEERRREAITLDRLLRLKAASVGVEAPPNYMLQDAEEQLKTLRSDAQEQRSQRERSMYIFLGLGVLLLLAGAVVRAFA